MNCAKCGIHLRFPKTWWYGCYVCGFPIDITMLVNKIRKDLKPKELVQFMEVLTKLSNNQMEKQ